MTKSRPADARGIVLGLVALLGVIVLAFDPGAGDAYQLPKAALLRVGALALLAAAFKLLPAGALKPAREDAPVLAYLAVCGLFTAFSLHPHTSFYGRSFLYAWGFWTLASLGILYWVASRLDQQAAAERLFAAGLGCGAVTLAYGLARSAGVPVSTFGAPLHYAGWLAMIVPLGTAALLRARTAAARAACAVFLLAAVHQLLATLSRGAWLGALVAVGLLLWLNYERSAKQRSSAVFAAAVLCAGLAGFGLMGREAVRQRLGVFLSPAETSAQARLGLWTMGLNMMRDYKGAGSGLDTFGFLSPRYETEQFRQGTGARLMATYAHNELLQVGVTLGVLGLAAYVWLWVSWIRAALRSLEGKPEDARLVLSGLLAGAVALWVHTQFNPPSVATLAFQWAGMGCLAAGPRPQAAPAQEARRAPAFAFGVCLLLLLPATYRMGRDWLADRLILQSRQQLAGSDRNGAVERGEAGLRLNPRGSGYAMAVSEAYRNRGLYLRGTPEMENDLARAIEVSRAALATQPLDTDVHHNYAMTLMWSALEAKKPFVEAAVAAELRAIELAPKLASLRASLGEILHFAGRVDEAKQAWLAALTLDPRSTKANAWIGRYAPKNAFLLGAQDIEAGSVRPGEAADLGLAGRIKVVNLKDETLRFAVALVAARETLYEVPEGYAEAPAGSVVEPDASSFELGPDGVRVVALRVLIPPRSANFGKKFCLLVRVRCLSFDVPVDLVARVLVTTREKGA